MGPQDEFVTSGSDDGNFFVWHKAKGTLLGIYEGDSSTVNMVEGHPHLPLVAVSGIDTTVKVSFMHSPISMNLTCSILKLFAPTTSVSKFSRMEKAEQIMETNARMSGTRVFRYNLATLLAETRLTLGRDAGDVECRSQ